MQPVILPQNTVITPACSLDVEKSIQKQSKRNDMAKLRKSTCQRRYPMTETVNKFSIKIADYTKGILRVLLGFEDMKTSLL